MKKNYLLTKVIPAILIITFLFIATADKVEALMLKMSLDDLTTEADSVVLGTVESASSAWDENGANIYTIVTVIVEESLTPGLQAGRITVKVPGGKVAGITQIVSDTPNFKPGENIVLFLNELPVDITQSRDIRPGQYVVTGNYQGKLEVRNNRAAGIPINDLKKAIHSAVEGDNEEMSLHNLSDDPDHASHDQFDYLGYHWHGEFPDVDYLINASGDRISQVRAAAETWSNAGANFSFAYTGTHSRNGGPSYNGYNEIMWYNMGSNYVLAQAAIWYFSDQILETDMTFNSYYSWSTTGSGGHDVQTVALHEFGHWLGLGHSAVYESIMYYRIKGVQRYLHDVDIDGIQYIYGTTESGNPDPGECTITSPAIPSGPTTGYTGTKYTFTGEGASCSNGHQLEYRFDLGDGSFSNWGAAGEVIHSWNESGKYQVRAIARCSVDHSLSSTWSAPLEVTILNQLVQYELQISIDGKGSTEPGPGTTTYSEGTTVKLTATPADGWEFVMWIIDGIEIKDITKSIIMDSDKKVTAAFAEASETDNPSASDPDYIDSTQHTLTIAINGEGTTNPPPGTYKYDADMETALEAVPASGWRFEKWVIENSELASSNLEIMISEDLMATAYFVKIERGDISGDGEINVTDVAMAIRYSLDLEELTEVQLIIGDVNSDGIIDVRDIALIMQFALGLLDSFPDM